MHSQKSNFSNWGHKIDLIAPGGDSICSATPYEIWPWVNVLSLRAGSTDMYIGQDVWCDSTIYSYQPGQHMF